MAPSSSLLFILAACSCMLFAAAGKVDSERKEIVKSAVAQVQKEFSGMKDLKYSKAQERLRAFKVSTPQTRAQGLASLKFERMVNVAERKILQKERQAKVQTTETMAEALAMELLHKPGSVLTKEEVKVMFDESNCFETITTATNCDEPLAQKHRLADGTCNNLQNPTWGAAATRMRRLLPARYDDGWMRARGYLQSQGALSISVFSPPYPSPRIASIGILEDRAAEDQDHTYILMQWGQFMDHDLDAVPEFDVQCPAGCEISSEFEGMCYPFQVPADDDQVMVTRTAPGSTGCHGFRRSLPACPKSGEIRPREQVNAITHFIDGSMVYHHDLQVQRDLIRDTTNNKGLLRTGPASPADPTRPLLPDVDPTSGIVLCPNPPCFLAGDLRVNEQSALTVMHTIWVREHNRVAEFIRKNNPSISGDKVFLIARDIVTSEIQKITYQDFLPILLGTQASTLIPPYKGYDSSVDPSVPNAFAAAAYRYGHSQIQPSFDRLDKFYQPIPQGPLPLVDAFFNTSHVKDLGIDSLLRGLLKRNARQVDEFLNSILTNRLFAADKNTPGLDLASLNIQRGRDHGLPTYLIWKQWAKRYCGVESDFRNQLTQIRLLQTYGNLDNVDLFVGGLAEKPLPGGVVGAVFACIFANTFKSVRDGDRFYYENSDPDTALFKSVQRAQIARSSLSRVICDNTGVSEIQQNAFLAGQPSVPCSSIPAMDLSVFNVATSGNPQLPDVCYARVRSNSFRGSERYLTASRRSNVAPFFAASGRIARNQEACFAFLCPQGTGSSSVRVIADSPRCSHQQNSNLSPSLSRFPRVYFQRLTSGDISQANGLYTSSSSCVNGLVNALTFTCGQFTSKQDSSSTDDNEGRQISADELSGLVHDDGILKEIMDEDESDHVTSSSASSADSKLANLMSELLQQLKTRTTAAEKALETAEKAHKMDSKEKVHGVSDEALVSELEKILEKA